MRFAFLTPEFPMNFPNSGGLATFLGRIADALVTQGHSVDVFLPTSSETQCAPFRMASGNLVTIRNVHVPRFSSRLWEPWPSRYWQRASLRTVGEVLFTAKQLALRLEQVEIDIPYDVIHGTDYGLTTWYVRRQPHRKLIVRSSSPSAEYRKLLGAAYRLDHILLSMLELRLFSRADAAYAPSRLTADYYSKRLKRPMQLIRPPFSTEEHFPAGSPIDRDVEQDHKLPERFLLHFGNINAVKGSDWLARSLLLAWKKIPELQMVWVGTDVHGCLPKFQSMWGEQAQRVLWTGPISRSRIPEVLRRTTAVVAPSRIDNLPNTVLEAQAAGVPVIGTKGSSIDEIVIDSVTGTLVAVDDEPGLADALVAAWKSNPPFDSRCVRPPIFEQMQPSKAVQSLLDTINATSKTLRIKQFLNL